MHENVEIDTGSGLAIISETTYRNYFVKYDLINNVRLKTCSGERLLVLGYVKVDVVYGGTNVNLLGRSWLSVIKLDWNSVFKRTYESKYISGKVTKK